MQGVGRMSDFNWAVERLKDGKKVRRACWKEASFIESLHSVLCSQKRGNVALLLSDFQAADWKLYEKEEEDDWDITKSNCSSDDLKYCDKKYCDLALRKLRQKILEDIDKNLIEGIFSVAAVDSVRQIIDKRFGFE